MKKLIKNKQLFVALFLSTLMFLFIVANIFGAAPPDGDGDDDDPDCAPQGDHIPECETYHTSCWEELCNDGVCDCGMGDCCVADNGGGGGNGGPPDICDAYWNNNCNTAYCGDGDCDCNMGNYCCGRCGSCDCYKECPLGMSCIGGKCGASTEVCDKIDNDCDGSTDEGGVCCAVADNDADYCNSCGGTWTGDGGTKNCCGDDPGEDYCSGGYTACYNAAFYTNGDSNSYTCGCGGGNYRTDWGSGERRCCGDDGASDNMNIEATDTCYHCFKGMYETASTSDYCSGNTRYYDPQCTYMGVGDWLTENCDSSDTCINGQTTFKDYSCSNGVCTSAEYNRDNAQSYCTADVGDCDAKTWQTDHCCGDDSGECETGLTQSCGNCGTKTCNSACAWNACEDEGDCSLGSTGTCGNCGTKTCTLTCEWSSCILEGDCSPASTQNCGNCGTQTCTALCAWGTCDDKAGEGDACTSDSDCCDSTNNYCGSGYCCQRGDRWDTFFGACVETTECYPSPCPHLPLTTSWWADTNCIDESVPKACCEVGPKYGIDPFYDYTDASEQPCINSI